MNKSNFLMGGVDYSAPEMEVISVAAECGVGISGGDDSGFGGTGEDDEFGM